MKVTVTLEVRFDQLPDGSIWTLSNFHETFWYRYLSVFDEVIIAARCRQVSSVPKEARRVDGHEKIKFFPLPYYIGPYEYLQKRNSLRNSINQVFSLSEAFIFRVGSPIADLFIQRLLRERRPFGVEVVGDPFDTFAPGANTSRLRFFFRWWFARKLKWETGLADAVSYVTSVRLPERYPAEKAKKVIFASSIELLPEHIVSTPRDYSAKKRFRLISVGALEDWRKGQDLALRCLKQLRANGLDVELVWIGDGRARPETEKLIISLGLGDYVQMRGQLPAGEAIFSELDQADLFLMPTRGEGLPRAMIEAMARALPVVASNVGGIPELLSDQFMHEVDSLFSMTQKIERLLMNPSELNRASAVNLQKSQHYLKTELQKRRAELYGTLRVITHEWQKNNTNR